MRNSGFLFLKKYPNVCAAGAWPSPLRTLGRRAAGGGPAPPPASATGDAKKNVAEEDYSSNLMSDKWETVAQGVDPKRGWNFRGVHKAILCGKVRQTPVQKLLRNGKTLTVFNVGTGGMFDQRSLSEDLPRPAQWHRIVVHNEVLGAYAVQQLTKNSSVYVEGDIELRVYNKGITGEVVKLPEICVRTNGKIRLIRTGEAINNISFQELRKWVAHIISN